jgi:citrate lyase beta subunit
MNLDERFARVRSVLETPVLDERKWAKLPGIACDAVLVDMEDAVPQARKEEGRARVLEVLGDRSFFGDRLVIARPNHLTSPWGYEDVVGLAHAGVDCMLYPKVRSVGEVLEVQRLLREEGADPDILVCIETPQAVARVEDIAMVEKVAGLSFGEGDLTADLGIPIYLSSGALNPALLQPRMRTILAAAAADISSFDFCVLKNIKDLDEFRLRAQDFADLGVNSICTIYPPHVDVVNEVLTPTAAQVDAAREVVAAVDGARAKGAPAVQLADGKTLLIHDYTKAQRVLARAAADVA